MIAIQKILMDYMEQPIGVEKMPQFGWVMESDGQNVVQTAYQLQLAKDAQFEQIVYDSGRVESAESAHVNVPDAALESCSTYYVRARVWTQHEESSWSKPSSFVTAMVDHQWQAQFISAETEDDWSNSKGTYLRKEWQLTKPVREAYVCATALGLYHLYLNGQPVGQDQMAPGWTSYHHQLCYQTYDVTSLLRAGANVIGAHVGAGWYKGMMGFILERNNYGAQTALLLQMTIRYEDGTQQVLCSDESWLGCCSPVTFSEIYDGERYDARLDQPGWNEPGFVPVMGAALPKGPGLPKRDRLTQPLTDEEKADQRINAQSYLPADTRWRKVTNVPFPLSTLTPQPGCRVKVMQELVWLPQIVSKFVQVTFQQVHLYSQ